MKTNIINKLANVHFRLQGGAEPLVQKTGLSSEYSQVAGEYSRSI